MRRVPPASSPPLSSHIFTTMDPRRALLPLALGALACGAPFSEPAHEDSPEIGAIAVTIDARYNVGDTPDPDGYLISGPGFDTLASTWGETVITPGFPDGFVVTIKLQRVAEWCNASPLSRTVTVRGGDTIPMSFTLTCSPLLRPVRIMLRSSGIRPDTSSVRLLGQTFGGPVTVAPGDTLRRMTPVGGHILTITMASACRRLPTDIRNLEVPYYPSDTINYVINRNCGVIRAQGDLQNGNTPQMYIEAAADSSYVAGKVNALTPVWGTRSSYSNATIARARTRINGGVTEWALTRTTDSTATEGFLSGWGSTFVGYPTWRRNNARVDYLLQDSTGVALWSVGSNGVGPVQLSVPGTLRLGSSDWSPDGTRLAYVTDQGIAIAPLNAITADYVFTPTASLTLTDPRWLPTGDTLIVTGAIDTVGGARNAIWRLDIATGTMVQLTTPPPGMTDGQVDVSSDGKYLAFYRSTIVAPGMDGSPTLMTLRLSDGALGQIPLPATLQGDPMWAK